MEPNAQKTSGKIFVVIANKTYYFSGDIEMTPDIVKIYDIKSKHSMEFGRAFVAQIVWDKPKREEKRD